MPVPFWAPAREYTKYKNEIDTAMQEVQAKGELVLGFSPEIEKFEKSFADFIGVKHCIMVGSGTQALAVAYKSVGIGEHPCGKCLQCLENTEKPEIVRAFNCTNVVRDEVITTSHTFIATIDQIVRCGAHPVLVDIDETTGLIDPELIENAITPRTKAIVPVHLEGKMCDMGRIMDIARKHNLLVIEDSAQAIGATYVGQKAGSIGDLGCYSFFPAKVLGVPGNGGAVTTNNDEFAKKARMIRCNYNIGKNQDYDVNWGDNYEPDAIHAAVLNVKLPYLKERLEKRKEVANRYYTRLAKYPIILPVIQEGRIYQDFVIRLRTTEERDKLAAFLKERGIGVLGHNLRPNHLYPALGFSLSLPKTEEYIATQIRIPCNPDCLDSEVREVLEAFDAFYAQ